MAFSIPTPSPVPTPSPTCAPGPTCAPRARRRRWLGAVLGLALACATGAPPGSHDPAEAAAEYAAAGRYRDAAREIEIALRRRPADPALRLQAAPIHEAVGAPARAAEDLAVATRRDPTNPMAWAALASFETRQGRFDAAYVAARRAHGLAPADPTLAEGFARAAERAGLAEEARAVRARFAEEER